MPELVDEASSLREEIFVLKGEGKRLSVAKKLVLKRGTEVSDLEATTDTLVSPLQDVQARVVEAERDLRKSQEIIATSDVHEKALSKNYRP